MGRALVKKINEFDLEENKLFIEQQFEKDPDQLKKALLELEHFEENNKMVVQSLQKD